MIQKKCAQYNELLYCKYYLNNSIYLLSTTCKINKISLHFYPILPPPHLNEINYKLELLKYIK